MEGIRAGGGAPWGPRDGWTMTAGTAGQGPAAACGTAARAAAFSVSQPSAGQVRGWIPLTTRDPTDPWPARRQRAGVVVGETSLQRSPPIPTRTTWLAADPRGLVASLASAARLAAGLPASSEVAIAKYWAAEGGQRVVHAASHLHGGVGVDRDYPLHRYFLLTEQIELTLGGANESLRRLGRILAAEPV